MQPVWQFIKALVILGVLGYAAYFIYLKVNEGPMTQEEVRDIAVRIGAILGDEKTELRTTDVPSVEFEVAKVQEASMDTIRSGLCLLDPGTTRSQYVAAELILLYIFESKPEGYVSRIDGEPWEPSGDTMALSQFSIDRTPGDRDNVIELVTAFGPSVKPRDHWMPKEPAAAEPANG